jgi:hypothetical protein
MDENLNQLKNENKIYIKNHSLLKSNIIFLSEKFSCNNKSKSDTDKTCPHCKKILFSKFSRDRHIKLTHLEVNSNNKIISKEIPNEPNQKIESNEYKKANAIQKETKISFIGIKHHLNVINNDSNIRNEKLKVKTESKADINQEIIKQGIKEEDNGNITKLSLKEKQKPEENRLSYNFQFEKINNECLLAEEKIDQFFIKQSKKNKECNITDIIKTNFYSILKNNEYLALDHYFAFKNLTLGKGKYGTVFFGINIANATPVAIKSSNEENRKNYFEIEELMMNKLRKFKIFSNFHDKILVNNKNYLIETLQGPNLEKLQNFCGGKFSLVTTYKIGIDILQCLKFIHKTGYVYLDLKCDNIVLLPSPIKYKKSVNKMTLIDFGFCEKYSKTKENSPKTHGNIFLASINALCGNAVSRKDDLISFCYFLLYLYLGYLPWNNSQNDNNTKEGIIALKTLYSPKKLCGNNTKEILFIFNDVNSLGFEETPRYNNYIELLKNAIIVKTGKNPNDIGFDWDNYINKYIKQNNGVENLMNAEKKIRDLFEGFPNFFVTYFLREYLIK